MPGCSLAIAWVLQGTAFAAPPTGSLTLQTTPNAQVERMPRTDPFTVQFVVRGNRTELHQQLERARARWLDQGHAVAVGGGTWLVNLDVSSQEVTAQAEPIHGGWRFILEPAETLEVADQEETYDRLGPWPPRLPLSPPAVLPAPLHGQASTLLPEIAYLGDPAWDREDPLTLDALEDARWEMLGEGGAAAEPEHVLDVGAGYLDLGLFREARYYLGQAIHSPHLPDASRAKAAQMSAIAHLKLGAPREASASCRKGYELGADEAETLRCLARVELIAGGGNPTAIARSWATEHLDAAGHALVGGLYFADHRYEKAIPHLEAAAHQGSGAVAALLGDAYWLTGEEKRGAAQWSQAVLLDPNMAARITAREGLAEMKRLGAPAWSRIVVPLERATRHDPAAAGDAHFGISRVLAATGDLAGASEHLWAVWEAVPEATIRSDVPDRLLAACAGRIRYLGDRGRWLDTIRVYEACWRPELDRLAANNEPLRRVATAYDHLGLPEKGLVVLRRALAASLQERRTEDDELIHLAHLYVRTGKSEEALETLHHLLRPQPHSWLAEGRARRQVGDLVGARRAFLQASTELPIGAVEAALIDAASGRCARALPPLKRAPTPILDPFSGPAADKASEVTLATARCLASEGDYVEAAAVAADALKRADLPASIRDAFSWLLITGEEPQGLPDAPAVPDLVRRVASAHQALDEIEADLARHGLEAPRALDDSN